MALGRRGVYTVAMSAGDHWEALEALLRKYADRPISLADACLIRCAELYGEPRIASFDSDFTVYKWRRTRRFQLL